METESVMFTLKQLASIEEIGGGRKLSAADFLQDVQSRTDFLIRNYKIGAGDSVLLLQNNSVEFFINLLALFQTGAAVIPFDPQASRLEIETIKTHALVSLVISENEILPTGTGKKDDLSGTALLLYTSGTTGKPKAVMISYEALIRKINVLQKQIPTPEVENTLCALPTFFGHGLICNSLFPLLTGKNFFIAKKFDLLLCRDLPAIINQNKISFFSTVPSVWQMLLNFSESAPIPSLKRVHCASSPLTDERAKEIQTWLGKDVLFYNIYGITEMLGWFVARRHSNDQSVNCFKEFWETEHKLSQEGELLVKSDFMFQGYYNNPEANSSGFTHDGFFKTGDLFEDDCLKGRKSLVINKKGLKIYPEEINHFLIGTDLIHDCHSFAKKDDFSNELLGVLVVLKKGCSLNELKEKCMKNLPPNKVPDFFIELESIERNARGKISKDYIEKILTDKK